MENKSSLAILRHEGRDFSTWLLGIYHTRADAEAAVRHDMDKWILRCKSEGEDVKADFDQMKAEIFGQSGAWARWEIALAEDVL